MCVSSLRKSKKPYYENLNIKIQQIIKNSNEKLIKDEYNMVNIFNTFFIEIVPNLGTTANERYLCNDNDISDPIEKAIQKYKNHPCIYH